MKDLKETVDAGMIVKSRIAQLVFDAILGVAPRGNVNRINSKVLMTLRETIVKSAHDPAVAYDFAGSRILLPFSHNLPLYRKAFPHYSSNVARIAHLVKLRYPELTFIDIGANVGDTVALLRMGDHFPILCIDGDKTFFAYLQRNAAHWPDVELVNAFVGDSAQKFSGKVESVGGTSYLVGNESTGEGISMLRLSRILEEHPRFARSKMIKLDTDGFDCRIIRSERALLAELRPVLFFEYAPYLFGKSGADGYSVFEMLREIGYRHLLVYQNTGEYLLTADFDDNRLLRDIHHFYSGGVERYCDICAIHEEDADLVETIRQSEIEISASGTK